MWWFGSGVLRAPFPKELSGQPGSFGAPQSFAFPNVCSETGFPSKIKRERQGGESEFAERAPKLLLSLRSGSEFQGLRFRLFLKALLPLALLPKVGDYLLDLSV